MSFVDTSLLGITRERRGKGFCFRDTNGERITNKDEIARLNSIALPPAYERTWYSPDPNGHILAIGYDARGRRQYRYHPDFRAEKDSEKFDRCLEFGERLPTIRMRMENDLRTRSLGKDRAIASVVRLLDTGGIRIGSSAYEKENKSYGATTLKMRHVKLQGETLHLRFKAKSGQLREMHVSDRGLVRFVRKMQDLPGQNLFQYINAHGEPEPINSSDVNAYIRETMGEDFTAKHFRTWRASALAYGWLHDTVQQADKDINSVRLKPMLDYVSAALGNTPTMARNSYIHPAIIAAVNGEVPFVPKSLPRKTQNHSREERGLIEFLNRP